MGPLGPPATVTPGWLLASLPGANPVASPRGGFGCGCPREFVREASETVYTHEERFLYCTVLTRF